MSLGIGLGGTSKCNSPKCQCCKVTPTAPISKVTVNGQLVNLPNGNCKSKNVIYLAQCNLCVDNCYVGRTVQPLNKRVNGHRQGFANVVNKGLDYIINLIWMIPIALVFICIMNMVSLLSLVNIMRFMCLNM